MRRTNMGILLVAIFIGILGGSAIGEILALAFNSFGIKNNVVEKVLLKSYVYELYPIRLNLIVMSLTFGFSLNFNLLSFLGIGIAWYYVKYSY